MYVCIDMCLLIFVHKCRFPILFLFFFRFLFGLSPHDRCLYGIIPLPCNQCTSMRISVLASFPPPTSPINQSDLLVLDGTLDCVRQQWACEPLPCLLHLNLPFPFLQNISFSFMYITCTQAKKIFEFNVKLKFYDILKYGLFISVSILISPVQ